MFCFHYIGQITCCKNRNTGKPYYSLYLPSQSWAQRNDKPDFMQSDLDYCASFNKNNHILHKDNVKELNSFAKGELYGYRMADDMQSVYFTIKNGKSFTASLQAGNIIIVENEQI